MKLASDWPDMGSMSWTATAYADEVSGANAGFCPARNGALQHCVACTDDVAASSLAMLDWQL